MRVSENITALFLAALLTAAAAFAEPDDPRPRGIRLDSPEPGQRVKLSAPVVAVSGRADAAELYASDIVIAIDLSNSSLLAAGADVDGDGTLGKTKIWAKNGKPTVPFIEYTAARRAIAKTRELAAQQIRLCTFAFGEDADLEFLSNLARLTQCHLIPFEVPRDLLIDRVGEALEPRQLTIVNLTTGKPARAVRILPDGGFDGFAMLVPGENQIEVSAILADGRHVVAVRTVHYEPAEDESELDRRNAARLLIELRRRTREVEATNRRQLDR